MFGHNLNTKIIFTKLFDLLGMRNLILSSLNTARSRAARLLVHIFTRFPLLKLTLEEFFLPLTYTYMYNESYQMNIFKYFFILD